VREILGVGEVISQPADQEVADIIIIIGSDFEPPRLQTRLRRPCRDRKQGRALDSSDFARLAAEAASDKKAEDIVVMDVAELLVVTDYFVICTGRNDRQVRTIAEEVEAHTQASRALSDRRRGC
jgi:hypothetical protein